MHDNRTQYLDFETPKQLADYIDSTDNIKAIAVPMRFYLKFRREYQIVMRNNQPTYNRVEFWTEIGDTNLSSVYFK